MYAKLKELQSIIDHHDAKARHYEAEVMHTISLCLAAVFSVYSVLFLLHLYLSHKSAAEIITASVLLGGIVLISLGYSSYLKRIIQRERSIRCISAFAYYTCMVCVFIYLGTICPHVSGVPLIIILLSIGQSWLHFKEYVIYNSILLLGILIYFISLDSTVLWLMDILVLYLFGLAFHIANISKHCKIFQYQRKIELDRCQDCLTGLMNRRALKENFVQLRKNAQMMAVIMIDLDRFKSVNDTFGHGAGDLALTTASDIFQRVFDKNALAVRLGGDEFLMVLSVERGQNLQILQKIQLLLDSVPLLFQNEKDRVAVTFSIGCYVASSGAIEDLDVMIEKADAAVYYVKQHGRNGAYLVGSDMSDRLLHGNEKEQRVFDV